ncbi:MAG: 50S ribosomal protein L21 [Bifidobacteriaceae bacterium]|jgi:large subunit ribosomal protein L21|nr:50S ribosomal protein L21 [Bifidobacteriaceae bacterium]
MTYAVVKVGGHQEKVHVGGTIVANRLDGAVGDKIDLPAILLEQDGKLTVEPKKLKDVLVSCEIVNDSEQGKKINVLKFKNKVRYIRRIGARQQLTRLKVLAIEGA